MGLKNMNGFFEDGLENAEGMTSNGYVMKITKRAEVHIYMPRENATADLQKDMA